MILVWVFDFQIQLSNQIWIANRKLTLFGVFAVTIEAPLHRQRLDLRYHFHLVNATVTGNAADTLVDVSTMVEVNEVRQIVNALPRNWISGLQTFSDRFEQCVFGMDHAKRSPVGRRSVSTVAIAARRRRRDGRMTRFFYRVVAVATVHLQFTGVQLVTERNRLLWLMAHVDDRWMDRREQARSQVTTDCQRSNGRQGGKFINPCGKVELLHRESPESRDCENRPLELEKPERYQPSRQPKALLSSGNTYILNRRI